MPGTHTLLARPEQVPGRQEERRHRSVRQPFLRAHLSSRAVDRRWPTSLCGVLASRHGDRRGASLQAGHGSQRVGLGFFCACIVLAALLRSRCSPRVSYIVYRTSCILFEPFRTEKLHVSQWHARHDGTAVVFRRWRCALISRRGDDASSRIIFPGPVLMVWHATLENECACSFFLVEAACCLSRCSTAIYVHSGAFLFFLFLRVVNEPILDPGRGDRL